MTGSVELDPDGIHLLIRFAYREDLVAMVKGLPGRRWDPKGKVWRVPAAQVAAVFDLCSRHLFDFAPEIPSLLAGTLRPATPAPAPARAAPAAATAATATGDGGTGEVPALSVSALNARVRDGLRRQFPDLFWVTGEIVDFDKSAGRSHRFFQLVEKARGEARPLAAVEVALFAATAERLLPMLAAHEPPLALRDGLEIRVLVRVDLHPASGRYQIVVQDVDPSFTLGKLALTKEQILRELAQHGLAERNRRLGFAVPALRIGVLTSPDCDGWNDLLRHVQEARVGLELALFPIKVQGFDLKPTLLAGLRWFADRAERFDVLCIVRGGGSRTDLAWFDDRDVAFAVARHPLKIVVGIGHQRDQSVLDAIAHSEKTPTAVAAFLVRGVLDARDDVGERARRLRAAVDDRLAAEQTTLARASRAVAAAAHARVRRAHADLGSALRAVVTATRTTLVGARATLQRTVASVRHAGERRLDRHGARLEQQATRIRLLHPARVLARGYTIVRDAHGRVLPSSERTTPGAAIRVQWRDGHADAHVDSVQRDPT